MEEYGVVETLDFLLNEYYKFTEICEKFYYKKFQLDQFDSQVTVPLSDEKWFYSISLLCSVEASPFKQEAIRAIKSFMCTVSEKITSCFKDDSYNYHIEDYNIDNVKFSNVKIFDGFICEGKSEIIFSQTRTRREFEGSFYFRKRLLPNSRGWIYLPVEYYKIYILYDILCSIHCYGKEGEIFYLYRYLSHSCFEQLPCSFGCDSYNLCCNEHRIVPSTRHKQFSIDFLSMLISIFVNKQFNCSFYIFYNRELTFDKPYFFKRFRSMEKTTYSTCLFKVISKTFYLKLFNFYYFLFKDLFDFVPTDFELIRVHNNLKFLIHKPLKENYRDDNILTLKYWQRKWINIYSNTKRTMAYGEKYIAYFPSFNYYLHEDDNLVPFFSWNNSDYDDFSIVFFNLNRPTKHIYEDIRLNRQEFEIVPYQGTIYCLEIQNTIPILNHGVFYAYNLLCTEMSMNIPAKGVRCFSLLTSHSRLNFLYLSCSYIHDGLVLRIDYQNKVILIVNTTLNSVNFNSKLAFNFFLNSSKAFEDFNKFI